MDRLEKLLKECQCPTTLFLDLGILKKEELQSILENVARLSELKDLLVVKKIQNAEELEMIEVANTLLQLTNLTKL